MRFRNSAIPNYFCVGGKRPGSMRILPELQKGKSKQKKKKSDQPECGCNSGMATCTDGSHKESGWKKKNKQPKSQTKSCSLNMMMDG